MGFFNVECGRVEVEKRESDDLPYVVMFQRECRPHSVDIAALNFNPSPELAKEMVKQSLKRDFDEMICLRNESEDNEMMEL